MTIDQERMLEMMKASIAQILLRRALWQRKKESEVQDADSD